MIRIGLIMIGDAFFTKKPEITFPGGTNMINNAKTMIRTKWLLTDDRVFLGTKHDVLG
jgi:hypothetical protein